MNSTNPTISIIIPIYNTEKYLRRCLDSIVAQTYKDFECILVDDGSTDGSGEICDEYTVKDSRFKAFHNKNHGVGYARNFGLDEAKGNWIYFCDSDDKLSGKESLQMLADLTSSTELIVTGHNDFDEEGNRLGVDYDGVKFNGTIEKKEFIRRLFDKQSTVGYQGYLWTKLFNKGIIEKHHLRFDTQIKFAEDMLFVTEYCCLDEVRTIRINNPIKVYDYIHRKGSAMGSLQCSYNPNFFTDFLAFEKMYHLVQTTFHDKQIDKLFLRRLFVSGSWILGMMQQFNDYHEEQKLYIENVMSRHPMLNKEYAVNRSLSLMKKHAMKLPLNQRADFVNKWLRSKDCHFKYLSKKWKLLDILSVIAGSKGLNLIKNKLNFQ